RIYRCGSHIPISCFSRAICRSRPFDFRNGFGGRRIADRQCRGPVCLHPAKMLQRLLALAFVLAAFAPAAAASPAERTERVAGKLDSELRHRASAPTGNSRVILQLNPGASADTAAIRKMRGLVGRRLVSVGGQVAYVPDSELDALSRLPGVSGISLDRPVHGSLERTGATIGSTWVHQALGFDGTGVGVAIID